ncbi:hypothetical protein Tco_0919751, partial [Tanacetum coccineum]
MSGYIPSPVTDGGRGGNPPPTGDNPPVVLISNLDVGNSLHVHTSDNSSSILVLFKLLGTENYKMDSYADSDVLCAQWDRCNAIVLTWIMNVVSNDVYMGLVYFENDVDVWKEVNETYDKVDGYVVYNLLQKIKNVKQGGSIVADYYHSLLGLLFSKGYSSDVKGCLYPLWGGSTVYEWNPHRKSLETAEAIDTKMNATSFTAKSYNQNKKGNTNNFNRNNNRGNGPNHFNRGPNPNLVCKNRGFTGHTIEMCYELIGYPLGYKKGPNA